jgi:hypothetical protein
MSDQTNINRGFLKDKLGNYQVDPPEKVWDGVSGQIAKGHRRRGFYILLLASAASIALALTLGIHFFGPDLPREIFVEELPGEEIREDGPARAAQQSQGLEDESGIQDDPVQSSDPMLDSNTVSDPDPLIRFASDIEAEPVAVSTPVIDDDSSFYADPLFDANPEVEFAQVIETDTLTDPLPSKETIADLLPDTTSGLKPDPFYFMEEEKKRDPRWMVGAAVSPLYSYRDAEDAAMPSNPGESGLLSYSTGVHINYRRNSRLAFETGIYYNKTGIAIGAPDIKIFSRSQDYMVPSMNSGDVEITTMNNSVGNIVAYSGDIYMNGYLVNAENGLGAYNNLVTDAVQASESGIEQHLDYLELPFNLRYSVIDRTIELQLVGGMSTNFLISNYVTMEGPSGQEEIGYLSNVNTVNLSGNAGLGMIYHVGKRMSFLLEPRFRYFINSVNDAPLPSTRPYSLGLYTGLSYTF